DRPARGRRPRARRAGRAPSRARSGVLTVSRPPRSLSTRAPGRPRVKAFIAAVGGRPCQARADGPARAGSAAGAGEFAHPAATEVVCVWCEGSPVTRTVAAGTQVVRRVVGETYAAGLAVRAGLVTPERPDRLARMGLAVARCGMLGGLVTVAALRYRDRAALIDERGAVTFRELDERTTALANAWRARGLRDGEGVAVLTRNHRGFHYAVFAAAKCGARIILLNTDFGAEQLRAVLAREEVDLLVCDEEFTALLGDHRPRRGRYRAWTD